MKTVRFALVFRASLLTGMDQNRAVPQFGPTAFYRIAPTHYRIGTSIKVADVNGDGFVDVIVVAPGTTTITVWLGDGSGKLKDRVDSELGGVVYSGGNIAAGDFDGDGHLDLAIAMNNSPLHVMKGDGRGGFKFSAQLERVGPICRLPGTAVCRRSQSRRQHRYRRQPVRERHRDLPR
jgi:hypothetical protein